jgi:hypothetical protein
MKLSVVLAMALPDARVVRAAVLAQVAADSVQEDSEETSTVISTLLLVPAVPPAVPVTDSCSTALVRPARLAGSVNLSSQAKVASWAVLVLVPTFRAASLP